MAGKRKRVSYTAEFKLNVVSKAVDVGNREAARQFQVDESNVRLWIKQKEKLSKMSNRVRSNRHGLARWPVLEENLARWILAQRQVGTPISTVKIRMKARIMAQEMGHDDFQGNATWCYRFMKRKNLRVRSRTTVGQSLPADWEKKMDDFLSFTKATIAKEKFEIGQIINMDEVPMTFDCPPNRTVDSCGIKTVPITTTGHEKTSFTVVLACAADGQKLSPMVIFKRKTIPKEDFPNGVIIQCNEKGWMREDVMKTWLSEIWRKRPGAFFRPNGLLIMDSMRAHLQASVKDASAEVKAKLSIIPGGLTKKLQPLDISVNKVFKTHIRRKWEDWMCEGLHTFTKTGKMRRASYAEVTHWVKDSWAEVSKSCIQAGFTKSGIVALPDLDEIEEVLSDPEILNPLPDEFLGLFDSECDGSEFEGFE